MSYSLFRTEIGALTGYQHISRMQYSQVISSAYNNLILRCFETLTGGGIVVGASARLPLLYNGILSTCEMNLHQSNNVNFFNQISPYIYSYWAGQTIPGPLGLVTITGTGSFKGPIIAQNFNIQIFISIFCGVVATHILTLTGQYLNYVTGVVSPWSGALLLTTP